MIVEVWYYKYSEAEMMTTKRIELENSEITGIGSHEELSEWHSLYRKFFEQQSY